MGDGPPFYFLLKPMLGRIITETSNLSSLASGLTSFPGTFSVSFFPGLRRRRVLFDEVELQHRDTLYEARLLKLGPILDLKEYVW